MTMPSSIGTHLAVLNLFREADGTVEITVAEARGAMAEPGCRRDARRPIDYVEGLIVEAAARIEARRALPVGPAASSRPDCCKTSTQDTCTSARHRACLVVSTGSFMGL